jgi:hypothetical protein
MGIPKFFRWLTRRYPLILKNIKSEEDCPPIGKLLPMLPPEKERVSRRVSPGASPPPRYLLVKY